MPVPQATWCWRRWISPAQQDVWVERLQARGDFNWALVEKPNRSRLLLESYLTTKRNAEALVRQWGGQVHVVPIAKWLHAKPSPPLRIGRKFEIASEGVPASVDKNLPRLCIPHGLAFGSGEHATTAMLLRALARHNVGGQSVLDLGTGSGVLALAARLLGARKIIATDFDPDAVRTARQNEALNFSTALIVWRRADVKQLRGVVRYDLVLANLFSGILDEAAPQIARSVAPAGQLWLSGILRSQARQVTARYRREGLKLLRMVTCGKWVMLQWQPSLRKPLAAK